MASPAKAREERIDAQDEDEEEISPLQREHLEVVAEEPSRLKSLLGAMDDKDTAFIVDAPVRRYDPRTDSWRTVLSIPLHRIEKDDYEKASRMAVVKEKRGPGGKKIPDEIDQDLYRMQLIYQATTEEGRKELWDNREVWAAKNCRSPLQVIEKATLPGERAALERLIDKISGFGQPDEDDNPETVAGN